MSGVAQERDGSRGCHEPLRVPREKRTAVQHARRIKVSARARPADLSLLLCRLQTRHHIRIVLERRRAALRVVVALHDPTVQTPRRPVQLIAPDVHETNRPPHRAVLGRAQSRRAAGTKLREPVVVVAAAADRSPRRRSRVCLRDPLCVHHAAPDHPPVIPRRAVVNQRGSNRAVDAVGADDKVGRHRVRVRGSVPFHEGAPRLRGAVRVLHELDAVERRVQVHAVRRQEGGQRRLRLRPPDADQARPVLRPDDGGKCPAHQTRRGLLESPADAAVVARWLAGSRGRLINHAHAHAGYLAAPRRHFGGDVIAEKAQRLDAVGPNRDAGSRVAPHRGGSLVHVRVHADSPERYGRGETPDATPHNHRGEGRFFLLVGFGTRPDE